MTIIILFMSLMKFQDSKKLDGVKRLMNKQSMMFKFNFYQGRRRKDFPRIVSEDPEVLIRS